MTMGAVEWLIQADKFVANQKWADAAEAYEEVLKLDSANIHALNQLGIVYEELDQVEKAEQSYQTALKFDPNNPSIHYNLGMLYKSQGRMEQTQRELEKYLSLSTASENQTEVKELLTELFGLSFEKCTKCGCISILKDAFKLVNKELVCPACYSQIYRERLAKSYFATSFLLISLATFVYGLPFIIFLDDPSGLPQRVLSTHYLFVNFLLILAFRYLLIIPHELFHAIGAWLAQGKVFEIRVGVGQKIFEKNFGCLIFSLYKYPSMGACIAAFPNRSAIKTRVLTFVAMPILFHFFIVLVLLPGLKISNFNSSFALQETFVLANVLLLIWNLIPRQIVDETYSASTDGLHLKNVISGKLDEQAEHATYFLLESGYSIKAGNYEQAIKWCEDGLQIYPQNPFLKSSLGIVLLELEKPARSLTLFGELLSKDQVESKDTESSFKIEPSRFRAIILSQAAYALLLNNFQSDGLKKAYKYAEEAFKIMPWEPSIKGIWGAILIETDAMKEGIDYLSQVLKHSVTPKSKAMNLAQTAVGYYRLGEQEKAIELLKGAVALNAECYLVKKAQTQLGLV